MCGRGFAADCVVRRGEEAKPKYSYNSVTILRNCSALYVDDGLDCNVRQIFKKIINSHSHLHLRKTDIRSISSRKSYAARTREGGVQRTRSESSMKIRQKINRQNTQ